jgi:hypothetical protein
VNTSELVAKITKAHSVGKSQAQGIVDSMLKSLASARHRNQFKMTTAKRGSPRPANECAARRLRAPLRESSLIRRQGGERAVERLNVFAVVGGDQASRSPKAPCNLAESISAQP